MGVFWLKTTYTFLTDRNAFSHPFYRSNYQYFTDYEFLPVIGFNAGDEENNFLNIPRYAVFRAEALPKNEATTSAFYWTNKSPSRPRLGTNPNTRGHISGHGEAFMHTSSLQKNLKKQGLL